MNGTKASNTVVTILKALIWPLVYIAAQILITVILTVFETMNAAYSIGGADYYTEAVNAVMGSTVNILLFSCVITLLAVAVTLRSSGRPIAGELKLTAAPGAAVVLCLLLGVVLNYTLSLAMAVIPIPEETLSDYNSLVDTMFMGDSPFMTVLTLAVLVPLTEEVVFRGMAMNTLRKAMPVAVAVILQAVIFAVTHGNILQIAYVLPVALIFGVLYMWSDSLIITIAAHIGFNALSAVVSVMPSEALEAADTVAVATGEYIMQASIGAVISIALLYAIRSILRKRKAPGGSAV